MHTIRKLFFNEFPTPRTHLRGVARVNQYYFSTSVFSFVRTAPYELIPSGIGDGLVQAICSVIKHSLNLQIFKDNDTIGIDKPVGKFMSEVTALVSDAFVDTSDNPPSLGSLWRSF